MEKIADGDGGFRPLSACPLCVSSSVCLWTDPHFWFVRRLTVHLPVVVRVVSTAPPPIVPRRGSSASSPAIIVKDTHRYENVTTKAALPAPTAASSPAIDLSKYPWFASGFDRQRAEDAMVDRPDGESDLIRQR